MPIYHLMLLSFCSCHLLSPSPLVNYEEDTLPCCLFWTVGLCTPGVLIGFVMVYLWTPHFAKMYTQKSNNLYGSHLNFDQFAKFVPRENNPLYGMLMTRWRKHDTLPLLNYSTGHVPVYPRCIGPCTQSAMRPMMMVLDWRSRRWQCWWQYRRKTPY